MFQCLLEEKMKTNMLHNGGKLKGTNWIKPMPVDITWSQWPTAASAFSWASVCLARTSSDRSRCALAEPDWHWWIWEAMPCWEKFQLAQAKSELKKQIFTTNSLAITLRVTWTSLAADKSSESGLSLAICGTLSNQNQIAHIAKEQVNYI